MGDLSQHTEYQNDKIYAMENHQGKRLREYIRSSGVTMAWITQKLGHGSNNTIFNWCERDKLTIEMLAELSKIFPDIMGQFPEVEWKKVSLMVEESPSEYGTSGDTKCQRQLEKVMDAHLELMERFNSLMSNHLDLTMKYGDLQDKYLKATAP